MSEDNKRKAYLYLENLAVRQGYIFFDCIIDVSEAYRLSALEVDWLSNSLLMKGILIRDERLNHLDKVDKDEDYNDYSHCDYGDIFDKVLQLEPSLNSFINYVRTIRPPQFKEISKIIYHAKDGNKYARDRIIEMHIRSAIRIGLQRALLFETDLIDCIGDACEGLVIAFDKYEPGMSGAFISFASMWIYQNISRWQPNKRPSIYYPAQKRNLYFSIYPVLKNKGCTICDRFCSCQKIRKVICEQQNCSEEQTEDTILQMISLDSYDALLSGIDNELCDSYDKKKFIEQITTDTNAFELVEYTDFEREVDIAINTLTEREQLVIRRRFGLGYAEEQTLEDIGSELMVTRERIRQIESSALKKLRKNDALKSLYCLCM